MKKIQFIFCALLFLYFSSPVKADLIFNITGTPGSNIVQYEATGFVMIVTAAGNTGSAIGLAPGNGTGSWISSFDNNLGNFLRDDMNGNFNDDLDLSNGGVSYRKNGTQFGVLNTLDLDGAVGGGGDDVELDNTANIPYPSLVFGDVLSWTGSGTFTLEDGETFDSLFVATGTFSNAIDGGNYVVNIMSTAVPEPGSFAVVAIIAGYILFGRRRRHVLNGNGFQGV